MSKNKKILTGVLCICLIAALAIGGTLAFLTDSEKVTNTFTIGDIDIELDEPNWDDLTDGQNLYPGDTKVKDPTVTEVLNNSYMRAIVTIIDDNDTIANPEYVDAATTPDVQPTIANPNKGKPITDKARLAKILQTIRYDDSYDVTNDPATANLIEGTKYTAADLAAYKMTNEADFTIVADKSSSDDNVTGVYYYNYNQIFNQGDSTVLFTNIVIPSDWNQNDLAVLGKYKVEVFAQAIQASNFADATEAFAALDAEVDAGTLQNSYKS